MEDSTIERFLGQLDNASSKLEETLIPLLSKTLSEHALLLETPLERVKLYNNNLYLLISVLYSYLKLVGIDTKDHPIMKELARIKLYMNRAKEVETNLSKDDDSAEKEAKRAKDYLQQALGGKVNGGGAASTDSLKGPAISKHTKFVDDNDDSDTELSAKPKTKKVIPQITGKGKKSQNKVTKPKRK